MSLGARDEDEGMSDVGNFSPPSARSTDSEIFAVIAGGGTAGHVLPALAVAEALVATGRRTDEIHYIGAQRGIEARMLPNTPYAYTLCDVVGFQRRLTASNLSFLPRLFRARRVVRSILAAVKAKVVISVGGYGSLPAVLAARSLGIPVVVISYDRRPGRASQLAARWAAASAVSFADSKLPRAVMTGAPVRASILGVRRARDRAMAREHLGVDPHRFMIAVMGGSQGSGVLNSAVTHLAEVSRADHGVAIYHILGERFLADAATTQDGSTGVAYHAVGFEDRMDLVYAACDLLIARGGASTVHEVAVTGTPAVLVPWADAADDHQRLNVEWLSQEGGAIMLEEHELGFLADLVEDLRMAPSRRIELGSAAFEMGAVHRSHALTTLIASVALA
jgi:UDP-N-acetylglucosamine--N-acetylmuramyl-(pentapeptide) pyrophosphoryl-undecaprenol N-acetylglucosamine transferase